MKLIPTESRLIVKPIEVVKQVGNIILAEPASTLKSGKVMAIGEIPKDKHFNVNVGDTVYWNDEFSAVTVKDPDEGELTLLSQSTILAYTHE